jgi:hypothetical protein
MIAIQVLCDNKNKILKNNNKNINFKDFYPETKAEKETSEVVNHIIDKIDLNNNENNLDDIDIDNNNIISIKNNKIFNNYNKFYMKKKIKEYSKELGIFLLHFSGLMFCRYLSKKINP